MFEFTGVLLTNGATHDGIHVGLGTGRIGEKRDNMSEGLIDILLVDDHAMVREGLAALASKDPGIRVVGQVGDGLAVLGEVERTRPHVVVLDISMPGLNGLDICLEIMRKFDDVSVLMLTMHADEQFIARALEYGASGYLLKEAAADQLTRAIHAVADGEMYLGPGISKKVLYHIGQGRNDPYEKLTPRERQVLQLIAEGRTNRQISEVLELSIKTIDTHRLHLMRKLDIHDQITLVKFAIRRGLVGLR